MSGVDEKSRYWGNESGAGTGPVSTKRRLRLAWIPLKKTRGSSKWSAWRGTLPHSDIRLNREGNHELELAKFYKEAM